MRRPDFLGGLGIAIGASDVTLAAISKRLLAVRVRAIETTLLPGRDRPAERQAALATAVREFVRAHEVDPSHVALCIPRADAAVTRALLPAAASENLAQVLEYEMENLVPLPREEILFDYAVRPLGLERIAVVLVCVPREAVRGYLEALTEAGVQPRKIGIASTAIADYVTFCRGGDTGPMGLVIDGGDATELALFKAGRLVATQLLPASRIAEPGTLERSLARQLADEVFDPEKTALYRWTLREGARPLPEIGDGNLAGLARGKLAAPETFFASPTPSSVPAVGAALAAVREDSVHLNLLPVENREAFDEGPSMTTWVLLAASVVLLLVWVTSGIAKDILLRSQVQARLEEVAPEVREVKGIQGDIDDLQRQVEILGSGQDGRVTSLLKDLSDLIPPDAYLTTMNLRQQRLTLDGLAKSPTDLITALEKSKRFKSVAFSSPTTKQGDKERFSISAEVVR